MTVSSPALQSIQVGLCLGAGFQPAPLDLMQALEAVEVTQTDEAPSRFQLTFRAEVAGAGALDYAVVQNPLLQPATRVVISAAVNAASRVLIDGFITRQQFAPSDRPGAARFTAAGEDLSVKMDAIEVALEFPEMGDAAIAGTVLAKYALLYGVTPNVKPTLLDALPFGYVPQQNGSDREYLKQLAQQNGNLFYIQPGAAPGESYAYWGPPVLAGTPQPPLDVSLGPFTNVSSLRFSFDSLKPTFVYGFVMETLTDPYLPFPILTVGSTRSPQLAATPALSPSQLLNLAVRKRLWLDQGMDPVHSWAAAQGMTDLSTDAVVTGEGELDAVYYGGVLTAPGLVGVRGAGANYDGLYYVKQAQHRISAATGQFTYRQGFTLTREGLGSTESQL
ncbi:MAG TPA: hypothetical protein VN999_17195 [Thermoanaerobaculia bacterium]|nr:hypothetical protein [Thermoanaerobaculia bacterium]